MTEQTTVNRVAELNDRFRKGDLSLGEHVATQAVAALSPEQRLHLTRAIRSFDDFTEGNDPYGEHDFGSVVLNGEKYFWKISYYDSRYEYGSDNPANPAVTRRVLTVMHHSEY